MMMILFATGMIAMSNIGAVAAMNTSQMRKETRFLTDKMAYELNMNSMQYDDVFEINFDFLFSVRDIMDDVVRGYGWAVDRYYQMLDVRNDDLRWVLSDTQYRRFMITEDFYRPIYANSSGWHFRVYVRFPNINLFFFGKPRHYSSYKGAHNRIHHHNNSYYHGRYTHNSYNGHYSVRSNTKVYHNHRHSDFGSIKMRPNTNARPAQSNNHRPGGSNSHGNHNSTTPNRRPGATARPTDNKRPSSGNSVSSGSSNHRPGTATRPTDNKRPSSGNNVSSGSSNHRPGTATRPVDNKRPSSGNNVSSGSSSSNHRPSTATRPADNKQRPANNSSATGSSSRSSERKPAVNNNSGKSNHAVRSSSSETTRRSSASDRSGRSNSDNSSRSSGSRNTRR